MTEKKNLVASILARLKNLAKENDVVYSEILARYAIERVLKRNWRLRGHSLGVNRSCQRNALMVYPIRLPKPRSN